MREKNFLENHLLFKPKVTRLAQFYPSSFIIYFSILFSIGIGIMKREKSKSEMLSFLDLTALGLGNSMGIGIFVLLGILTRTIAGPAVVLSIFISAITAALSGAKFYCTTKKKSLPVLNCQCNLIARFDIAGVCFAEFGTRFLKADSAYSYCYSYHRENVSFIFGWALILEFIAGFNINLYSNYF